MVLARPEHEVAYQDIMDLIGRHKGTLTPVDLLAIASNIVGKLIALQDQRKVTVDMAMKIVHANIEVGNKTVLDDLRARHPEGSG